jgi:hypothetical protein
VLGISAKTTQNEILAYAIPDVPSLADAVPMTHVEVLELVKENRMPTTFAVPLPRHAILSRQSSTTLRRQ